MTDGERLRKFHADFERLQKNRELERLDLKEYEQLVWEIYNRLEVEAFDRYWQRHNRWIGPPDRRWIYNDITRKYWWPNKEKFPATGGCWINRDYTGHDTRFPPHIKDPEK